MSSDSAQPKTWQTISIFYESLFRCINVHLISHRHPCQENHTESLHNDDHARMFHGQNDIWSQALVYMKTPTKKVGEKSLKNKYRAHQSPR
jgi:hypothetical protein